MVDAFAALTDASPQPELPEPLSYGTMDTFWVNNEAKQRWINIVNEMKTTPSYDPRDTSITVLIDSLADGPGNWEVGTLYGDGTLIRHRDGREMFAWVWDNEGSSGIDDPTSPGTPNTDGGGGDLGGGGPGPGGVENLQTDPNAPGVSADNDPTARQIALNWAEFLRQADAIVEAIADDKIVTARDGRTYTGAEIKSMFNALHWHVTTQTFGVGRAGALEGIRFVST